MVTAVRWADSPASVRAYATDVAQFAEWATRAGADGPADIDQ